MDSYEKRLFGRVCTSRAEYWIGLLFVYALLMACFLPFSVLGGVVGVCGNSWRKLVVSLLVTGVAVLATRKCASRLHDAGMPGWAALVMPLALNIEGREMIGRIEYSCTVGALPILNDLLSDKLSAMDIPIGLTLNGMAIQTNFLAVLLLLFLGCRSSQPGGSKYDPSLYSDAPEPAERAPTA